MNEQTPSADNDTPAACLDPACKRDRRCLFAGYVMCGVTPGTRVIPPGSSAR
jgi:hypothetical protein